MTAPQLYEQRQIKPEWRAQGDQDSWQVSVHESGLGAPYTNYVELTSEGREINPAGEDNARPGNPLLRMYAGLTIVGAEKVCDLVQRAYRYVDRGSVSLATLVKYLDDRMVTKDEQGKGTELAVVEAPNFLYGKAWKRAAETYRGDTK